MIILSTKKLSKQQIALFDEKKFTVVHSNFIITKAITFKVDQLNEFVIFTSKNAIKSVLKNSNIDVIRNKKCFCVGEKSKLFLEKYGLDVVAFSKDAETLVNFIIETYSNKTFTFFSGTIRKDILPKKLIGNNFAFNEITVYKTVLNPKKIKLKTDVLLFFSPSAVESYLQENEVTNQTCFCIGKTTAKALEGSEVSKLNIIIASQPSVESVIEEVIKYNNY